MSDLDGFLERLGLSKYLATFAESEVELADLAELSEEDLKEIGLPLGPRRRILKAIREIDGADTGAAPAPVETANTVDPEPQIQPTGEAERRQLTVMFVDLVGSTALAERLDPEEMREVITAFQQTVAGVVTRFEGNVAKYMGDGVLCYFGWPQAHEDDAERAVRAGLGILETMSSATAPGGGKLMARVGIATGLVVVGDLVGDGAAQEEAVVGQTPNLAARLQGLAQPGQCVIADTTRRLLSGLFDFADLGKQSLKGIASPVSAYAVRGERVVEGRFDAQRTGGVTEMVGREQELALLIERWRQAAAGEGQMVLLTGEAGIGKSRIARGLFDSLVDTDHVQIRYQCSPYHMDSALFPTTQQLALAAGFHAEDLPEARLDKLETLLARAGVDVSRASPLIASLLGLGEAAEILHGALDYSPQQRRMRTLEELVNQLEGLSVGHPVLFTLEDAHWIDPTTLELIELCLDRIDQMHVLILVTARPTFQYGFGGHPNVTRLALNRLGRIQVRDIVAHVTKGKSIPAALLDEIAAKTDGVPLFVEEFTKTVLESPALRETEDAWVLDGPMDTIAIPTSLHDSLMARLDRLQSVKEVAQTAACIGREFDHQLLSEISPLSADGLKGALGRLIEAELLFRRGSPPDATYIFKHALVRDAAYESLLRSNRKLVHARIVSALEAGQGASDADGPVLLAQHCELAELKDQAIDYWQQAGQKALERSSNVEAIAHLKRGVELIQSLPSTMDLQKRELKLQTMLGGPLISTKGYGALETGAVFARARELSEQVDDPTLLFPVLYQQWVYDLIGSRIQGAQQRADNFIQLAGKQDDSGPKIIGHRIKAVSLFYRGKLSAARDAFEAALALYDRAAHLDLAYRYGQDPRAACLAFLARIEHLTGHPEQAMQRSDEALEQAMLTKHTNTLAYTLSYGPVRCAIFLRDLAAADLLSDRLLTLAEQQGLAMWKGYASVYKGWILSQKGRGAEAVEMAERGVAALSATRTELDHPLVACHLAQAYSANARHDDAIRVLDSALDFAARTDERWCEAELHRLRGRGCLALEAAGCDAEAERHYLKSIDVAQHQGAKSWELRSATELARLWGNQGERRRAFDLLAPLHGWFTEGLETPDLKDAEVLLRELA